MSVLYLTWGCVVFVAVGMSERARRCTLHASRTAVKQSSGAWLQHACADFSIRTHLDCYEKHGNYNVRFLSVLVRI